MKINVIYKIDIVFRKIKIFLASLRPSLFYKKIEVVKKLKFDLKVSIKDIHSNVK